VFNNQRNIAIIGAANQSSILAPASGDAIKVMLSSNITIENIWLRSQGSQGRGLTVLGSSVNVQNIKTDGTLGDGALATNYKDRTAIGGDGTLANTMENYANGRFITESNGFPSESVGNPNVAVLGNTFFDASNPVPRVQAISSAG
jgi:hypothetical protein